MKSLPQNPSLEFLKKQARALRNQHRDKNSSCCERIRIADTSYRHSSDAAILTARFSINDAQRVVAREYGYASLKRYIDNIRLPIYHGVSEFAGYHKTITDSYDARSLNYDNSEWHREVATTTVNYNKPLTGQHVLDIATGTGTIAFYCAELVGQTGCVVGVDISSGMLKKCHEKLAASGLSNLEFAYGDGERLDFAADSFDRIYCANAIFWMSNLQAALRRWYELLRPGGIVGFNATPSTSFFWGAAARKALATVGIDYICNVPAGDEANARDMLECAGFEEIQIYPLAKGHYSSVEEAKVPPFMTLDSYAPGQHPHPLAGISQQDMDRAQQVYNSEVDKHATEQGIWHDMTQLYIYGRK